MSVLVLNASYEPLNVVSVRRAVVLLLMEKAQLVEAAEARIRAERMSVPRPIVIRLVTYVRVPYRLKVPVSRRGVFARDHYSCQYCGERFRRNALTIDHVLPRSRGGERSWENLVAACGPCNRRKGNRTPAEAAMRLRSRPSAPRYIAVALIDSGASAPEEDENHPHQVWQKYLDPFLPSSTGR